MRALRAGVLEVPMDATLIATLGGVIGILAGFYLIYADRLSRRPTEFEQGLTPTYLERAGAQLDGVNWTTPFVRVATYPGLVVIACASHQVQLRPGDVTKVEVERHLFSTGLRIHHLRSDVPSKLVLWPRDIQRLKAAIEASLLSQSGEQA